MTSAKIQPFCRKCKINQGVYNRKQRSNLHKTITEKNDLFTYSQQYFLRYLEKQSIKFLDAIKEIENNFRYEETQINYNILQKVIENKFPIYYDMDCQYDVFAFDLETCNVEYSEYCESYAAGVYHLNNLHWCFNGSLNKEEPAIERSKVHVFDRENSNPVLKMIDYVIKI